MNDAPITYEDYFPPMVPDFCYHIFNRTINKEFLFKNDENRKFFLQRIHDYLLPVAHFYAFCLLNNHFHFLARIKSAKEITDWVKSIDIKDRIVRQHRFVDNGFLIEELPLVVEAQFHRFFTSYAKAFNKQHSRTGSLFQRPFKRLPIQDEFHFGNLVYYIHRNPTKHGLIGNFRKYRWSSYQAYLYGGENYLDKQTVLDFFGGQQKLIEFHQKELDLYLTKKFFIEK